MCWCVHRVYALIPPELGGIEGEHRGPDKHTGSGFRAPLSGICHRHPGSLFIHIQVDVTSQDVLCVLAGCVRGGTVGVVAHVSPYIGSCTQIQAGDMVGYSSQGLR